MILTSSSAQMFPWSAMGGCDVRHLLVTLLFVCGCQQAAREAGSAAAPPAVGNALQTLAQPENQPLLDTMATSPGVEHLGENIGWGVGRGIIDEAVATFFGSEDTDNQPATQSADRAILGRHTSHGDMAQAARPATQAATQTAAGVRRALTDDLSGAIDRATGPEMQRRVQEIAVTVSAAVVAGALQKLEQEGGASLDRLISDHIGPALSTAVRTELGPAIGEALRKDIAPGLRAMARDGMGGALDPTPPTCRQRH
jgi:hypothetical protein